MEAHTCGLLTSAEVFMYVHQTHTHTHTINTNLSQGSLNEGRKRPLLISSKQEITFIEDSIVTFFWRPSPRHEGLDSPRLASRDLKIIQERVQSTARIS